MFYPEITIVILFGIIRQLFFPDSGTIFWVLYFGLSIYRPFGLQTLLFFMFQHGIDILF